MFSLQCLQCEKVNECNIEIITEREGIMGEEEGQERAGFNWYSTDV